MSMSLVRHFREMIVEIPYHQMSEGSISYCLCIYISDEALKELSVVEQECQIKCQDEN